MIGFSKAGRLGEGVLGAEFYGIKSESF